MVALPPVERPRARFAQGSEEPTPLVLAVGLRTGRRPGPTVRPPGREQYELTYYGLQPGGFELEYTNCNYGAGLMGEQGEVFVR